MTQMLIGGRYELLDCLGSGGMGDVYRSRDRITEEVVALKRARRDRVVMLPRSGASGGEAIVESDRTTMAVTSAPSMTSTERAEMARLALASEFRVLSALRHPNIVSVLDYGFQENGSPFFTMRLLTDPVTIVHAARGQPLDVLLHLLFQMLYALSYLHRHGIVHRDLKPSNVLVMGRQVTVLDFGVSGLPEFTVAGTAGFLAPEVVRGARPSPASDFYAVGGIAYEMLTGKPVYRAGHSLDVKPLEEAGRVGELVRILLSPNPAERRYSDANRLIDDLAAAAGRDVPKESQEHRDSYLQAAPLIGRSTEIGLLANAIESAAAGRGGAWLVGGESGVGKSRLLDEIRSRAQVRGLLALTGTAEENQAPYAVFRPIVSRLALLTNPSDEEAALLKVVFPDIERVLARPIADVASDPQQFQDRLIETVCHLFGRYPGPILLELEDCHLLADGLPLLQRLTQMAGRLPLLIVASFRDNERPELPGEFPGMHFLRLTRFDSGEIRSFAASMLGRDLGANPAVVSYLARETEGNAFFLIEAVRELVNAAGRLGNEVAARLPERAFSGGMQAYVRRRLDRLPSWARGPLEVAAIIGRQVDLDVLRAAAPDADLDALLVVCGNAAILEGYGYQSRFTHDKLREALLAEMDDDRRRQLSLTGAEAIESVYGAAPEWIQTQAALWREARVPEKAAHYLLLASAQLLSTGSPDKALRLAVDAASEMGVELPDSREDQAQAIVVEMQRIAGLMAGREPAQLIDLAPLADDRIARIIAILMLIGPASHISQQLELFALSALKCFTLTLEHGIGAEAPKVVAMYAAVVRELTQDSRMAFAFSTLAMDLDRRLHGRVSAPPLFLHAWFINHWIHPLKTNAALAWDGARVAFTENDVLYGCFNASAHVMYLGASGAPLRQVVQEAERQSGRIADRVRVSTFHCVLERQFALALMGRTAHRLSLTDERYEEERDLASICATANYNQIGYYFLVKMRLHYYYREYATALECADRTLPVVPAFRGQIAEWEFAFYRALASAARAQEGDDPARTHLLDLADSLRVRFDGWASVGPANFAHKRDLIRAELFRARGLCNAAAAEYEAAAQSAAASGFVHDHALVHERAGLFHQTCGDAAKACAHLDKAARLYQKWEAAAKVDALRETRV